MPIWTLHSPRNVSLQDAVFGEVRRLVGGYIGGTLFLDVCAPFFRSDFRGTPGYQKNGEYQGHHGQHIFHRDTFDNKVTQRTNE